MLVNDLREKDDVDPEEFFIVMFTKNADSEPCLILKFTRDKFSQWSIIPFSVLLSEEDESEQEFHNCLLVKENIMVLVLSKTIVVYDSSEMSELSRTGVDVFGDFIDQIDCFSIGFDYS